jgi:hypothetical protein
VLGEPGLRVDYLLRAAARIGRLANNCSGEVLSYMSPQPAESPTMT